MIAWRICREIFADLSGEGARLYGGRWTSPGFSVVYLAEHPALAMLEILVHLDLFEGEIPEDYVLLEICIPDSVSVENLAVETKWQDQERSIGDVWFDEAESGMLCVPSLVMPKSRNLILSACHPESENVRIAGQTPLSFDPRLFSFGV